MFTNARTSDPSESAAAFDPDQARLIREAVCWLYTLGPARDGEIVERYFELRPGHPSWPDCSPDSVRKRCSDARKQDKRIQHLHSETSSAGRTCGVYGYVEVVAA